MNIGKIAFAKPCMAGVVESLDKGIAAEPPTLFRALLEKYGVNTTIIVSGTDEGGEIVSSEDRAGEEVVDLYYSEDGDPTRGFASQHSTLYVNHKVTEATFEACGTQVRVNQTPEHLRHKGVTGCVVWNGAVVLGAALEHWCTNGTITLAKTRVLELCAGSGLLAVTMGLLGAYVVTTEQVERLALLSQNVAKNASLHPSNQRRLKEKGRLSSFQESVYSFQSGGELRVRELDWFDVATYQDPDIDQREGFDVVVATDVIYNEEVTVQFVSALATICSQGSDSMIPAIITLELRTQEIHLVFIERLLSERATLWRLPQTAMAGDAHAAIIVTYLVAFAEKP